MKDEFAIVINWQDDLDVRIECVPAAALHRETTRIDLPLQAVLAQTSTWAPTRK